MVDEKHRHVRPHIGVMVWRYQRPVVKVRTLRLGVGLGVSASLMIGSKFDVDSLSAWHRNHNTWKVWLGRTKEL